MIQAIALVGSICILAAYAANQRGSIGPAHISYASLNLFGSGTLAIIAVIEEQWGFLLLEGVWALISLWAFGRLLGARYGSGNEGLGD